MSLLLLYYRPQGLWPHYSSLNTNRVYWRFVGGISEIIDHKVYEVTVTLQWVVKYIIFFMLYIIVGMAPKTTTTGLLTTTFVK